MLGQFKQFKNKQSEAVTIISFGTLTTAFSGKVYYYGMMCRVLGGG